MQIQIFLWLFHKLFLQIFQAIRSPEFKDHKEHYADNVAMATTAVCILLLFNFHSSNTTELKLCLFSGHNSWGSGIGGI